MRRSFRLLSATLLTLIALQARHGSVAACAPDQGIGVARTVVIDAAGGPVFGRMTPRSRERSFLGEREVVLTFDDGPTPGLTRSILDTLDRFCTKATFFAVGRMAIAYPETAREILQRGHTLGSHTWSHPMSLPRIGFERARDQIEAGFAAVAMAAGGPIAPFFRFPGLNDSAALIEHLERRDIATFAVDVISNDSHIASPDRLVEKTLSRVEAEGGGIVLFHDIKPQTARALPTILTELKARGYKVVHLVAARPYAPDPAYVAAVVEHIADRKLVPAKVLATLVPGDLPAPAPKSVDANGSVVVGKASGARTGRATSGASEVDGTPPATSVAQASAARETPPGAAGSSRPLAGSGAAAATTSSADASEGGLVRLHARRATNAAPPLNPAGAAPPQAGPKPSLNVESARPVAIGGGDRPAGSAVPTATTAGMAQVRPEAPSPAAAEDKPAGSSGAVPPGAVGEIPAADRPSRRPTAERERKPETVASVDGRSAARHRPRAPVPNKSSSTAPDWREQFTATGRRDVGN